MHVLHPVFVCCVGAFASISGQLAFAFSMSYVLPLMLDKPCLDGIGYGDNGMRGGLDSKPRPLPPQRLILSG